MKTLTIENKIYTVPEDVDEETRAFLSLAEFNEQQIKYHRNMIAVLTKAKRAYISSLKKDILAVKAGLDFLE